MDSSQNQIVSRKKTFWKMVKTIFMPAQTIAKLMVGCGSKKGKGKRRLTLKNMQQAKEAFLQASFQGAINRSNSRRIHSENDTSVNESRSTCNSNTNAVSNSNSQTDDAPTVLSLLGTAIQQNVRENGTVSTMHVSTSPPLHVPLNLEEAEFLLESLTLCNQSPNSENNEQNASADNDGPLEIVEVEVLCESHDGDIELSITAQSESSSQNEFDTSVVVDELCVSGYEENESGSGRERSASLSGPNSQHTNCTGSDSQVVLQRSRTTVNFGSSGHTNDFSGWRNSSIEVTSSPPITLAFIPSGLCVGDRVVWVKDDHPEIGTVRWIGKIRQQFYAGLEFDKPVGNSSGIYGYGVGMYKRLFTCQLSYGRFVPVKELVLYKDYHDSGVKSGIVCVICRDDFLDTWESDILMPKNNEISSDDMQPFNMVSTKCGHLYHWGCLDNWFSTKKRSEFHCPVCSRTMDRNEVIRIFPSQL